MRYRNISMSCHHGIENSGSWGWIWQRLWYDEWTRGELFMCSQEGSGHINSSSPENLPHFISYTTYRSINDNENCDPHSSTPFLLVLFTLCSWCHNRWLVMSQLPDNCDATNASIWKVISNSLDIDFIHGYIDGWSCKKKGLFIMCSMRPPQNNGKLMSSYLNFTSDTSMHQEAQMSWGRWCQKLETSTWISNNTPQYTMGCDYLSLPQMPACGTNVLS